MKFSASFFSFGFFALILVLSCSKDSSGPDNNTVTVSGKVTLEGVSDYSGVTVSLYAPVALNPEIAAINQQYPNIGVKISQETEFDHREGTAAYSATTNAAGEWSIGNVAKGTYHLVAQKSSFGWRYLYNNDLNGDRTLTEVQLYPEITLRTTLDSSLTLQSGRTYFLEGDFFVLSNGQLIIEDEVTIIAKTNARLIVLGGVLSRSGSNGFSRFTAQTRSKAQWRGLVLSSAPASFARIIAEFATTAVTLNQLSSGIQNLYCRENTTGLVVSNATPVDSVAMTNLLLRGNDEGMLIGTTNAWILQNAIVLNSSEDGLQVSQGNGRVHNSYFLKNARGISVLTTPSLKIEYCNFEQHSDKDLLIDGAAVKVLKNILTPANLGVKFTHTGNAEIHENNFLGNAPAIDNLLNGPGINAQQNWWNTASPSTIEQKILHKPDVDPNDPNYNNTGVVDFSNYYLDIISSSGIQ